jgi:hypothetical protein
MRLPMSLGTRYALAVLLIVGAWYFARDIDPVIVTLIGLILIAAATIWFVFSLFQIPRKAPDRAKSLWKLICDAFWGL